MSDERIDASAIGDQAPSLDEQLRALQERMFEIRSLETTILLDRLRWAREHGVTFDGARKEYDILGYDKVVTYRMYRAEYDRGGIAGRVVDVMPDACWRGEVPFEIIEDEDPEKDTPFEQAWKALSTKHAIPSKLYRADKLSRLSTYSVILIGAPGTLDQELPKVSTPDALLYLKPYSGGGGPGLNVDRQPVEWGASATIHEYETNPQNPRFGHPKTYKLKQVGLAVDLPPVHWSRIIHVAEGVLEDEVFGRPALERVWNLLADLRKITGGGSEAFWLRANQGFHVDVDKDMALGVQTGTAGQTTTEYAQVLEKIREDMEAYKHNLTRWIRTRGVKIETLGSDVANFSNPADAVITQIAGSVATPKRVLTGSEMGELASSQDRENFRDQIIGRQTTHLGPNVIRQLVDRLIAYGFLPSPKKGEREYQVRWPHIQVLTEQEKSDGAMKWSQTKVGEDPTFTLAEIRDKWYGMAPLTAEQIKEIDDRKMEAVRRQAGGDGWRSEPPQLRAAQEAIETLRALYDPDQLRDEHGRWTTQTVSEGILGVKRYKVERIGNTFKMKDAAGKTIARVDVRNNRIRSAGAERDAPEGALTRLTDVVNERLSSDTLVDKSEAAREHWLNVGRQIDELIKEHGVDWLGELVKRQRTAMPRAAEGADDELVRILADAITADAGDVVLQILGIRSLEFDESKHPRDSEGQFTSGGGDTATDDPQGTWAEPKIGVKAKQFNGPDRAEQRKAAVKDAHKELTKAGFEKEASEKKHTPSQKLGRSTAYSGTYDKRESMYVHSDGRRVRLIERWSKYGDHSVAVHHARSVQS